MKVLAYLAFTLLSILIQFSVMDLIQDKLELEAKKDLNLTSPKRKLSDILKEFSNNHALFYNNNKLSDVKIRSVNATEGGTEMPVTTTVYDILMYDENATTESVSTSESSFTTVEIENVTELSIFGTKNVTTPKPKVTQKKIKHGKCTCDLLYKVCDINCCCDSDCMDDEIKLFTCPKVSKHQEQFYCSAYDSDPMQSSISGLFCIAGSNLPDKRVSNYDQYEHGDVDKIIERSLKWRQTEKTEEPVVFTAKKYSYGDSIWLLKNSSISYIDVPSPMINSYCHGRTPIGFLKEGKWKCDVMIQHLEMLHVLKKIEETFVISVTEKFINDSVLNCSSLHCTNWTIKVCDESSCTNYNKTLHEPTCNDNLCTGLAQRLEYVFNYHDFKIVNATIYLHTQSYSPKIPLIKQEVSVAFYISENSTEKMIKFSGNPGYLKGAPVIISYGEGNYTDKFFNGSESKLLHAGNKNGVCIRSNTTNKVVTFGTISKTKCRYNHAETSRNGTAACENIHSNVKRLLGLDRKAFVSPLGNPYGLKDNEWLRIDVTSPPVLLYGEYNKETNALFCSNIITKVSFVFGYADVSEIPSEEKVKVLVVKAEATSQNMTFNAEDISLVLTFETMFVDVTKKPVYEYAGAPNLNIHLPKDFFFPFPSNSSKLCTNCNVILMIVLSYVLTFTSK